MAHRPNAGWLLIAGFAAVGAGALAWRSLHLAHLRDEVAIQREEGRDLARLRAENQRLTAENISPSALEALRGDRAALTRLRGELEALRARSISPPARPAVTPPAAGPSTPRAIPAAEWKNAGQNTPASSFETVMWAAAGGDVDALSQMLALNGGAKAKADALFASLSPAARANYVSAERLVAFLTAREVPLGTMAVWGQTPQADDEVSLRARIESANGDARFPAFLLRRYAEGWKLVVPESAIDKYAVQLREREERAGPR